MKETIRRRLFEETIRGDYSWSGAHDIFGVAHTIFLEWRTRYVWSGAHDIFWSGAHDSFWSGAHAIFGVAHTVTSETTVI